MIAGQEQILKVIQKHAEDPTAQITRESRIADVGVDSYGLIEVIFELEDELGIDIPYNANDSTFGDAETIGDLLDKLLFLIEKA